MFGRFVTPGGCSDERRDQQRRCKAKSTRQSPRGSRPRRRTSRNTLFNWATATTRDVSRRVHADTHCREVVVGPSTQGVTNSGPRVTCSAISGGSGGFGSGFRSACIKTAPTGARFENQNRSQKMTSPPPLFVGEGRGGGRASADFR